MKRRQAPISSPKAVRGSDAARRMAALLLEVWSGVRTAQSASEAMAVAPMRFYQLEARALQLMVSAMEPRQRGRQVSVESELHKLKQERVRLQRELERYQSLYRTAQRSLGIVMAKPPAKGDPVATGGKRQRGPRRKARGQAVAALLLQPGNEVGDGTTEPGGATSAEAARQQDGEGTGAGATAGDDRRTERGRRV